MLLSSEESCENKGGEKKARTTNSTLTKFCIFLRFPSAHVVTNHGRAHGELSLSISMLHESEQLMRRRARGKGSTRGSFKSPKRFPDGRLCRDEIYRGEEWTPRRQRLRTGRDGIIAISPREEIRATRRLRATPRHGDMAEREGRSGDLRWVEY